jgi:hypothetical protein
VTACVSDRAPLREPDLGIYPDCDQRLLASAGLGAVVATVAQPQSQRQLNVVGVTAGTRQVFTAGRLAGLVA